MTSNEQVIPRIEALLIEGLGWTIYPYAREEIPGLSDLFLSHWGEDPETRYVADHGYLEWQFHENPAGPGVGRMARNAEHATGFYGTYPLEVVVQGEKRKGAVAVCSLIRSKYRLLGGYLVLAEKTFADLKPAGVDFVYAVPNREAYRSSVNNLGFWNAGRLRLFIQVPRLGTVLKKLGHRWAPARLGDFFSGLAFGAIRLAAGLRRRRGVRLEEVPRFGEEFDAFFDRVKARHRNVVARRSGYLNWRYLRVPKKDYKVLAARKAGRLLGFACLSVRSIRGVTTGLIVDLLVDRGAPEFTSAVALLARAAQGYFSDKGAEVEGFLSPPKAPEAKALRRLGYVRCPSRFEAQRFDLIVRPIDPGIPRSALTRLEDWYFTLGDFDVG